ncbi:MAG: helix-turn-helix transcriptional regulator [Bacilli bacterium]
MLYEKVKKLCAAKQLSLKDLAIHLEISAATISRWKSDSSPNAAQLLKLANYFNVSVDYLLDRTDIPNCNVYDDEDIISIQRAKANMSDSDTQRMMEILKLAFKNEFKDKGSD